MMTAAEALNVVNGQLIPMLKKTGGGGYVEAVETLVNAFQSYRSETLEQPHHYCQSCSRLGGKVVSFSYSGMSESRWICPHCLDTAAEAAKKDYDGMREFQRKFIDADSERRELQKEVEHVKACGHCGSCDGR